MYLRLGINSKLSMRPVVLALMLATAAGCIIDSGESSGGAHLIVTWSLQTLATQSPAPCPVGYDTAAVYSQQLDSDVNGDPVGDPIIDLFNCSDGAGTTSMLQGVTYAETVAIATDNNVLKYATSVPVIVGLATPPQEVDTPPIYTDAGHFKVAWELDRAGAPVNCTDVPNALSVSVTVQGASGPPIQTAPFDCNAGLGYTTGILDGSYTVTVALLDGTGTTIAMADPIPSTIMTGPMQGNTITDLHTVTITVP
jgi:hypothetical protein